MILQVFLGSICSEQWAFYSVNNWEVMSIVSGEVCVVSCQVWPVRARPYPLPQLFKVIFVHISICLCGYYTGVRPCWLYLQAVSMAELRPMRPWLQLICAQLGTWHGEYVPRICWIACNISLWPSENSMSSFMKLKKKYACISIIDFKSVKLFVFNFYVFLWSCPHFDNTWFFIFSLF